MSTASTLSDEETDRIVAYLADHPQVAGIGSGQVAIASINLALTGVLSEQIPDSMSYIVGRWMGAVQTVMPQSIRGCDDWRDLIPLAAGTGRDHEAERVDVIATWMWDAVLAPLQSLADEHGFGCTWQRMLDQRTSLTARSTVAQLRVVASRAYRDGDPDVAEIVDLAADAAGAAADALDAAWTQGPARAAAAAGYAADARGRDAYLQAADAGESTASRMRARAVANIRAWEALDVPGILRTLVQAGAAS